MLEAVIPGEESTAMLHCRPRFSERDRSQRGTAVRDAVPPPGFGAAPGAPQTPAPQSPGEVVLWISLPKTLPGSPPARSAC